MPTPGEASGLPSGRPLVEKAMQTISAYRMLEGCSALLAGVSGGPDSVCLLHLLLEYAGQKNIRLGVAHFNHGLRGAGADQDEAFVHSLANRYGLSFHTAKADVSREARASGRSVEEAGRRLRYRFFRKTADRMGFDRIALGHTQADNAEQVLMNILRGSGPAGLCGIPPVRRTVIRPLIRVSREEIMGYAEENRLSYRTDPSNTDPAFLRNRIRHQLLPLLKKQYNPAVEKTLNRMADIFREDEAWLEEVISVSLENARISSDSSECLLDLAALQTCHKAHLRRLLRRALEEVKGDLRSITHTHINAAIEMIYSRHPEGSIDLPSRIRVQKRRGCLAVRREICSLRNSLPAPSPPAYSYSLDLGRLPATIDIPEISASIAVSLRKSRGFPDFSGTDAPWLACFDLDRIQPPLVIRNPRPGDRFMPLGMKGRQKVKDCFINRKVPRDRRPFYPIVADKDAIIWIAGLQMAEKARITSASRRIVRAELRPASGFPPAETAPEK
jgi:tRNA(Ile)-lysidine synthase